MSGKKRRYRLNQFRRKNTKLVMAPPHGLQAMDPIGLDQYQIPRLKQIFLPLDPHPHPTLSQKDHLIAPVHMQGEGKALRFLQSEIIRADIMLPFIEKFLHARPSPFLSS
jgi:hypothetical protein